APLAVAGARTKVNAANAQRAKPKDIFCYPTIMVTYGWPIPNLRAWDGDAKDIAQQYEGRWCPGIPGHLLCDYLATMALTTLLPVADASIRLPVTAMALLAMPPLSRLAVAPTVAFDTVAVIEPVLTWLLVRPAVGEVPASAVRTM